MLTISLNDRERDVLRHALDYYISELRMEVAGTDRKDFRDQLKDEEEMLKSIRERLQAETVA